MCHADQRGGISQEFFITLRRLLDFHFAGSVFARSDDP